MTVNKVFLLILNLLIYISAAAQEPVTPRDQWLYYLDKVAQPVMSNISADKLKIQLPVVLSETCDNPDQRKKAAYLEAFGRTLCGITPWLNIGLCGQQPGLADFYITTGSLYLCTTIFLPLGLPADDPFWTDPDTPWTAKKVWDGIDIPTYHSLIE
jgi:hypothetical protein